MTLEGTVVNGAIVLDGAPTLPEGARVRVELAEGADELDDIDIPTTGFEYPHPLAPYDREKELALLRESIAEMKAGVPGLTIEEAFAQVDAELRRAAEGNGK